MTKIGKLGGGTKLKVLAKLDNITDINKIIDKIDDVLIAYPSLDRDKLIHVILGEIKNGRSTGMHHYNTIRYKFQYNLIDVQYKDTNGNWELLNSSDLNKLEEMMTSGEKFKFKDIDARKWSAEKTVFPEDWDIEDIAKAGDALHLDGVRGDINPGKPDLVGTTVTIKGKNIEVNGFLNSDGVLESWFPVF